MYRPTRGTPVTWVFQDGRHAITTQINDTTDVIQWTIDKVIARYGDPRPALRNRKDVILQQVEQSLIFPQGSLDIEAVIRSDYGMTFFRFPLDPTKGALPGAINKAADTPNNRYNIERITDPTQAHLAFQQANDIAACLCPQGESSAFIREFAPSSEGFSTDRNNPTRVSLPNPPFGLFSTAFAGQTFWMYNDWLERRDGAGVTPDNTSPTVDKPVDRPVEPKPVEPKPIEPTPVNKPDAEWGDVLINDKLAIILSYIAGMNEEVKKHYPTGGGGRFVNMIRKLNAKVYEMGLRTDRAQLP
jgi:hypothetical protein